MKIQEVFSKIGKDIQLNTNNDGIQQLEICQGENIWNTVHGSVFATKIIPSIYQWTIEICKSNKNSNITIGITSNRDCTNDYAFTITKDQNNKNNKINNYFYGYDSNGRTVACTGNKFDDFNEKYNNNKRCKYSKNDIITMELNVFTNTLKYYKNGKYSGIIFKNIDFIDSMSYNLAISISNDVKIKLNKFKFIKLNPSYPLLTQKQIKLINKKYLYTIYGYLHRIISYNNDIPINIINICLFYYYSDYQSLSYKQNLMNFKEISNLRLLDKIDHRDNVGRFSIATIIDIDKQNNNIKLHYDGWNRKWDIWCNYKKEIYRFAKYLTISKRKSNRLYYIKIGDYIDINPLYKHPGWTKAKITRILKNSAQIQVVYKNNNKNYFYWVHIDNHQEVAEYLSKTLTSSSKQRNLNKKTLDMVDID